MTLLARIAFAILAVACLSRLAVAEPTQDRTVLTLEGAKRVAAAAVDEARRLSATSGALAVVDEGGALLYLERLDDTFPAAASVAIEKARTAAQFRRPTAVFEDAIKGGRLALLGVSVMTPLQGGVPVLVNGRVVGAIGVSGAASAQQDDDIARGAVAAWDKALSAAR
ncbi:MAG: heme-binding protein [Candidatus Eisenbacteria bacterium]